MLKFICKKNLNLILLQLSSHNIVVHCLPQLWPYPRFGGICNAGIDLITVIVNNWSFQSRVKTFQPNWSPYFCGFHIHLAMLLYYTISTFHHKPTLWHLHKGLWNCQCTFVIIMTIVLSLKIISGFVNHGLSFLYALITINFSILTIIIDHYQMLFTLFNTTPQHSRASALQVI